MTFKVVDINKMSGQSVWVSRLVAAALFGALVCVPLAPQVGFKWAAGLFALAFCAAVLAMGILESYRDRLDLALQELLVRRFVDDEATVNINLLDAEIDGVEVVDVLRSIKREDALASYLAFLDSEIAKAHAFSRGGRVEELSSFNLGAGGT